MTTYASPNLNVLVTVEDDGDPGAWLRGRAKVTLLPLADRIYDEDSETWTLRCRYSGEDVLQWRDNRMPESLERNDGGRALPDWQAGVDGDVRLLGGAARRDNLQPQPDHMSAIYGVALPDDLPEQGAAGAGASSDGGEIDPGVWAVGEAHLQGLRREHDRRLAALKDELDREYEQATVRVTKEAALLSKIAGGKSRRRFEDKLSTASKDDGANGRSARATKAIQVEDDSDSTVASPSLDGAATKITPRRQRAPVRSLTTPVQPRSPLIPPPARKTSLSAIQTKIAKPMVGVLRSPGAPSAAKKKNVRISAEEPMRIASPAVLPDDASDRELELEPEEDDMFDLDETVPQLPLHLSRPAGFQIHGASGRSRFGQENGSAGDASCGPMHEGSFKARSLDKYAHASSSRRTGSTTSDDTVSDDDGTSSMKLSMATDENLSDDELDGAISVRRSSNAKARELMAAFESPYATSLPMQIPPPGFSSSTLASAEGQAAAKASMPAAMARSFGASSRESDAAEAEARRSLHAAQAAASSLATLRQASLAATTGDAVPRGLASAAPLSSVKDVPELSSPSLARRTPERQTRAKSPLATAGSALMSSALSDATSRPRSLSNSSSMLISGADADAGSPTSAASGAASAAGGANTRNALAEGQFSRRREKWRTAIEASMRMSGLILPTEVASAIAADDIDTASATAATAASASATPAAPTIAPAARSAVDPSATGAASNRVAEQPRQSGEQLDASLIAALRNDASSSARRHTSYSSATTTTTSPSPVPTILAMPARGVVSPANTRSATAAVS